MPLDLVVSDVGSKMYALIPVDSGDLKYKQIHYLLCNKCNQ
jgi:hypothetical protein